MVQLAQSPETPQPWQWAVAPGTVGSGPPRTNTRDGKEQVSRRYSPTVTRHACGLESIGASLIFPVHIMAAPARPPHCLPCCKCPRYGSMRPVAACCAGGGSAEVHGGHCRRKRSISAPTRLNPSAATAGSAPSAADWLCVQYVSAAAAAAFSPAMACASLTPWHPDLGL